MSTLGLKRLARSCVPCCSTKEAFKKKIGFLGADAQTERLTDAFLSHGVVMKPEQIQFHAAKADAAVQKLGLHTASGAAEVSISTAHTQHLLSQHQ